MRASRAGYHRPWIQMPGDAGGLPGVHRARTPRSRAHLLHRLPASRTAPSSASFNVAEIIRGKLSRARSWATAASPRSPVSGYMTEGMVARPARGVHAACGCTGSRPTSSQGNTAVDRARRALRLRPRGLLRALPEGRRPLARPRALGDPLRAVARPPRARRRARSSGQRGTADW